MWLMLKVIKFRVQFSSGKTKALLHGDQSGTMVNHFFMCHAHVIGMMSSVRRDTRPTIV